MLALVCVDPADGIEGVVVGNVNGTNIPMVAPEAQLDSLRQGGQSLSDGTGLEMKLVRFTRSEVIAEFRPQPRALGDDEEMMEAVALKEEMDDGKIIREQHDEFLRNPPDPDMRYPRTEY